MIKQGRNKNNSLQETTTYLVQSKPQTIYSSIECQAMSLTNVFDIDSLQQFPLVRFCRKFFMDSSNLEMLQQWTSVAQFVRMTIAHQPLLFWLVFEM